MVVRAATDCLLESGERFIFHVSSRNTNARFVADFTGAGPLEIIQSSDIANQSSIAGNLMVEPEASFAFKVVSEVDYQLPAEEVRHKVDGWVVEVQKADGIETKALLSDVSESGAGILSSTSFQRGEQLMLHIDSSDRNLQVEAEIRYSVRSKIAPDMFKSGLKFNDLGQLEGAVWRNFLKAA